MYTLRKHQVRNVYAESGYAAFPDISNVFIFCNVRLHDGYGKVHTASHKQYDVAITIFLC
jgi:hypothetical protein